MNKTSELRDEINTKFIPFVEEKGFNLKKKTRIFYDFEKVTSEAVYIFNIQWEKYGAPRFVINFKIDDNDTLSSWGRLQPKNGSSKCNWFRQDRCWLLKNMFPMKPAKSVVQELIDLFPEVEEFNYSGRVGNHLKII